MDRPRLSPRGAVSKVEPGIHGGTDSHESASLGIDESEIIDFSASVSPYGPSPKVIEAIRNIDLSAYPDPGAPALTADIAAMVSAESGRIIGTDQVIPTAGSIELLSLVASAYLEPGRSLLTLDPYFGEYHPTAQTTGARVETFPVRHDSDSGLFSLDEDEFVEWTRVRLPAVVLLNDPHNPTGLTFTESLIDKLLDLDGQVLLVVDEAYRDFTAVPKNLSSQLASGRLILMRSLTKAHAMAGLRLGYGVSSPEIIQCLKTVQQPWTVSSVAQAAGSAALADTDWSKGNLRKVQKEKEFLVAGLSDIGLRVLPSSANFFLLDFSREEGQASALRRYLLVHRVRVRSCESFGLPHHIRISPRGRDDNERLLKLVSSYSVDGNS